MDDAPKAFAIALLGPCKCGQEGRDMHTCPFKDEIENDKESLCNCCENCTYDCAMEV